MLLFMRLPSNVNIFNCYYSNWFEPKSKISRIPQFYRYHPKLLHENLESKHLDRNQLQMCKVRDKTNKQRASDLHQKAYFCSWSNLHISLTSLDIILTVTSPVFLLIVTILKSNLNFCKPTNQLVNGSIRWGTQENSHFVSNTSIWWGSCGLSWKFLTQLRKKKTNKAHVAHRSSKFRAAQLGTITFNV